MKAGHRYSQNILFLPTGSTVAAQREYVGIMDTGDEHRTWSRLPQWLKLQSQGDQNRPCNGKNEETHKALKLCEENYLPNDMAQANKTLTAYRPNELINYVTHCHKSD